MPRYRVLITSHIGGRMRQPGDEVELAATVLPGLNLQPLNDEGRALHAEHKRHREVAIPPGSSTDHELRVALKGPRVLKEHEIRAIYAKPGHHNPSFPSADEIPR